MALLEINNLSKNFAGLTALDNISIKINEGEIRGLIGPNGAGKSTLFKNICGLQQASSGTIVFENNNIVGKKTHDIVAAGIVSTFQETTLFTSMTVLENVLVGCHLAARCHLFAAIVGNKLASYKRKQISTHAEATEILDFVGLTDRKHQIAQDLPLGSQRALAIAIALAAKPKLILLDEPFAGMTIDETQQMMQLTRQICDSGITIVLVEHDMRAVMGICDYITVLNFGTLLAQGTPNEILNNPKVIKAYLGGMESNETQD